MRGKFFGFSMLIFLIKFGGSVLVFFGRLYLRGDLFVLVVILFTMVFLLSVRIVRFVYYLGFIRGDKIETKGIEEGRGRE